MRHAALLRIVPWGSRELRDLPDEVYAVALRIGQEMIDYGVETERRVGQRTPGIEQHINAHLWETLKLWRRDLDQLPVPQTSELPL
jgi:hypothetical protein